MKNKKLLLIVSVVLAMTMSLGGTLAYLTDTDGDVNVMTVGNVQIEQNEYQRVDQTKNESEIEAFDQAKTMLPYVDGTGDTYAEQTVDGWTFPIRNENKVKNYVDKIVNVTNTGVSDAYVRTLIAIPEVEAFDATIAAADLWLHWNVLDDEWNTTNYNGYGWYWGKEESHGSWPADENWNFYNNVTIDSKVYDVFIGTNVDVLAKGATTAPSLVGIYLDKVVDCDINEDGTLNYTWKDKNGTKYNLGDISQLKVLTLSQAVQADGFSSAWAAFDAAFPIPENAEAAKTEVASWFGDLDMPTAVANTAELQAALDSAKDGDVIMLKDGVKYDAVVMGRPTATNDTTMSCESCDYTTNSAEDFKAHLGDGKWHTTPKYTTNLKNVTIIGAEGASIAGVTATSGHAYGDVYDYVRGKDYDSGSAYYNTLYLNNITFKNVDFTGKININTSDATSVYDGVTFDGCTFTTGGTASSNGAAIRYYNEANNGQVRNITVKNCKFNNCNQGVYVHHVNGVTVTGCEFDTLGHNAIALQGHDGAVNLKKVVITGNTFKNIADRVIRFGDIGADSNITIQNNEAINSGDDAKEVMKATSIAAGVTTSISGNKWGNGTVVNTELQDK